MPILVPLKPLETLMHEDLSLLRRIDSFDGDGCTNPDKLTQNIKLMCIARFEHPPEPVVLSTEDLAARLVGLISAVEKFYDCAFSKLPTFEVVKYSDHLRRIHELESKFAQQCGRSYTGNTVHPSSSGYFPCFDHMIFSQNHLLIRRTQQAERETTLVLERPYDDPFLEAVVVRTLAAVLFWQIRRESQQGHLSAFMSKGTDYVQSAMVMSLAMGQLCLEHHAKTARPHLGLYALAMRSSFTSPQAYHAYEAMAGLFGTYKTDALKETYVFPLNRIVAPQGTEFIVAIPWNEVPSGTFPPAENR